MRGFLITILVLGASLSQAAVYTCTLSDGSPNDPHGIKYSLNTTQEDNKMVDLGQGGAVGCVVLRSVPQLITCGIGQGERFSIFVTAEDGSSVISLTSNSSGKKTELSCIKSP